MNKSELTKKTKNALTLEENLKILEKEFFSQDLDKEEEINFGNNFEQKGSLNDVSKQKIQHLLRKKAEMDYLYIPENVRREQERKKFTICGIFSPDNTDRCRCSIF